ncbi:DUF1345 domain-containing protein [Sediminibacterium sp.]|uniref:DUF1345 domain-containing protein n=1 Tax=Sediminibacterium sp. TaxID=1917865 RepID=UPI0027354383|nr:DUF1345 domain-containing protein [Sediminibacterium sp.]MDP3393333.1 DUF1345 domain-containing protein [Sediminibacterium sp.]MDP3567935.1 DUF1345 domain-containing protein [Sediminibacterium sp.]
MSKKIQYNQQSWLKNLSGVTKVLVCILLTVVVYIILFVLKVDPKSRIILGWDTFCLCMILLSWILFFTTTPNELCTIVENQDDGLKIIFTIVLVAVCFSLFGTLLLLNSKGESSFNKIFHTIVSLSPVLLSWILLHTTFAIRYAHLYHDHNKLNTGSNVGGLDFPTKEDPDYLDFAYFSFVIGMTFQVSDVQVNSRVIRRFVLLHSLISFVFNTIIVALTINTIAGLKQ